MPWVEEPVMVTPEVVGHIDPVCTVVSRRMARRDVADLEAEGVAMEGQGCVRVVMREEGLVNRDVHDGHARRSSVTRASPKLLTFGRPSTPRGGRRPSMPPTR